MLGRPRAWFSLGLFVVRLRACVFFPLTLRVQRVGLFIPPLALIYSGVEEPGSWGFVRVTLC